MQIRSPRKLIEVALPLDDINEAAAREKSIRHGHPSTLHLWWARRPLAAARAVLFAQMVNDPGYETGNGFTRGVNKKEAARERERLFNIIRRLVQWENINNEAVLNEAREEIRKSWRETCKLNEKHPQAKEIFNPDELPAFHDPFAGGGAIPLEAQRLGIEAHGTDLNPVAVLINKALIEIPPRFAGLAPVGPIPSGEMQSELHSDWAGAKGLAEDVRRYGQWMREQAVRRIGHLYPKVRITSEIARDRPDLTPLLGQELTVISWIWVRTVSSPNPAYADIPVPLASTFLLSSKSGKEAWVEPLIDKRSYRFEVRTRSSKESPSARTKAGTTAGKRSAFRCLMSDVPLTYEHIRKEGRAGRMGQRLMAIVAEGQRGRIYLSPTAEMEAIAESARPAWRPDVPLPTNPRDFKTPSYGMQSFGELFTPRQLVALTTFSDLVAEVRDVARSDAVEAGMPDDGIGLEAGGKGATAYAEAISVYMAFAVDKASDYWSTICTWHNSKELIRNTFGRQAIPMSWDYAETNVFSDSAGNVSSAFEWAKKVIELLPTDRIGSAGQMDA